MKINSQKGAALMQVLLVTVILAGIATMLLRAGLARTSSARKTSRSVIAEMLIKSCMAEVNHLWAAKTPAAFGYDLTHGCMYSTGTGVSNCKKTYSCMTINGYQVDATMEMRGEGDKHRITYEIVTNSDKL